MKWPGSEKRDKKQMKIRKKRRHDRGIITVFATLMMVPTVAITGILVDVSRLKLYSSQAVMAADSYGSAVLSEYDHLLKQLYALFSATQNEEGLEALQTYAEYTGYSFNPNGDDQGFSGFMPYDDAELDIQYEKVEGASLSNPDVLMTQVGDFMRFRIVEEVMSGTGILDTLGEFDSMDSDMEVMEKRTELTDSSTEILEAIGKYYAELKKLAAYPNYIAGLKQAAESLAGTLNETVDSEEYELYYFYKHHADAIEAIITEIEEGEETSEPEPEEEEEDEEEEEERPWGVFDLSDKDDIYTRYTEFDVHRYEENLLREVQNGVDAASNFDSTPIDFDSVNSTINELKTLAQNISITSGILEQKVNDLEAKLPDCSPEVAEGIRNEIRELQDLLAYKDEFLNTCALIENHGCREQNEQNRTNMETVSEALRQAGNDVLSGEARPDDKDWPGSVSLEWYNFRDDKDTFYLELQQLCESGSGGKGDKNAGDEEIDKANASQEEAMRELEASDESTDARDISEELAGQLKSGGSTEESVLDLTDYFSGGLSFSGLSQAGGSLLNKFLLTTYDFGMFSSRVTGIEPEEEDEDEGPQLPAAQGEEEEYADYSMTGIKMSKDVNYLYGAELEYLLGGHNQSSANLNKSRNIICGVRLTLNFASTYTIKEVNDAIKAIAEAAAAAVTASSAGVGAAAAPLVRIAVSGALRLAAATIETAADWSSLMERADVVFFKRKLADLESLDKLEELLGVELSGDSKKSGLMLSYENYLYVLLCLLVDDNTLLSRTANLITLNVNQAQNEGDTLTELDFTMEDTVTAVKSTCKVKLDFVIVPDSIADLFYSGTDTGSVIESVEDRYYGYSVIRGY